MKTKATRFIGMLLFAVMVLTSVPIAAQADGYPSIVLDEEKIVTLDGSVTTEAIFSFTPAETALYMFRSYENDFDTVGYIMDTEENIIAENDDYYGNRDFHVAANLTAGTSYLLKARFYSTTNSGNMKIKVEKAVKASAVKIETTQSFNNTIGTYNDFYVKIEPESAFAGNLEWTAGDNTIIKNINKNQRGAVVFFGAVGTSTVSVTPEYGTGDTITVTVKDAEEITLDTLAKADVSVYESVSFKFTAEEDGTYLFLTEGNDGYYTSICVYDENMNSIASADVTQPTDARCTFSAEAGKSYVINCRHSNSGRVLDVYVVKPTSATAIRLNEDSYANYIDTQFRLTAFFEPRGAEMEDLAWSSSDDTVASVDADGNVSLLKLGTATITVTSASGFTDSCDVTVLDYDKISRCEILTATLDSGESAIYRFTPVVDGTYAFISLAENLDTYGYIYDNDMNVLATDDDGAENAGNFKVQYEMTAGVSYLLKAQFYNSITKGSYDVTVVMLDDDGKAVHNISAWDDYDHTYHSGVCSIGNEIVKEKHVRNQNGVCGCGYSHIHISSDWNMDSKSHWGTCEDCGQDIEEYHYYDAEEVCLACGYYEHDCEASDLMYDDYAHWGYCDICGMYTPSNHSFDTNGICVCGYFDHTHDAGEIAYNAVEHYLACTLCNLQIEDGTRHSYEDDDTCTCGRVRNYGVYIGDIAVMDGEYIDLDGNVVTEKPDTGYAYLKDGTLTLHDFVYVVDAENPFDHPSGIYAESPLTILLEGTNKIHCQDGDGIYVVNAALVIEGDGSIEVDADGDFDGIDADGGGLTVNGGIIIIDSTDHGIEVVGDLVINNGVFVIEADDDGLDIDGDVLINGGLFKIHAEDNGIDGYQNVTVNDGDFYIVTDDDNGFDLEDGDITINGGYFELLTEDEGISCYGKVAINGGTFVFDAGNGDAAIEAYDTIFIDASFGEYLVIVDEFGTHVLTDLDGDVLQDFILKPEELESVDQIQEDWVSFSEEGVLLYGDDGFVLPELTVTNGNGDTLDEGTDYTVGLIHDEFVGGGIYAVVVEGNGNYNGFVFKLYMLTLEEEGGSSGELADVVYGDVNGDDTVDSLDAAQTLKHDASLIALEGEAIIAGDVNGDGTVDSLDAAQILKYDAMLIESFPIEQN